ncbi:hypothetical protein VTJ49DRAFT_5674 [Mycothermus thermophilus]|uniref:DH domain-containing protein n=1 Tax=Humicola insolens TaxID=85995 RepID=A0ABR3VK69_HUMIN
MPPLNRKPDLDPEGHFPGPLSPRPAEDDEPGAVLAGIDGMMVPARRSMAEHTDAPDETTRRASNQEAETKKIEFAPGSTDMGSQGRAGQDPHSEKPFQRWVRMLHKRALRQQRMLGNQGGPSPWNHEAEDASDGSVHRRESSDSSLAFVTTVKPASISVAGTSLLARSWIPTTIPSLRGPRTDTAGQASAPSPRASEDSIRFVRQEQSLDPKVLERALQRRRIIDELVTTEEAYIRDLRFLANAYVTILAAVQTSPKGLRPSVNRTLNDMVELHEEILREVKRALSDQEYSRPKAEEIGPSSANTGRGHRRWRSLDLGLDRIDGVPGLRDMPGMLAEPKTAAKIARVFFKRKHRFFIYEEYSAVYDRVRKDVETADRVMPGWSRHQKGLEVLGASLSPGSGVEKSRRALAIKDLVMKPIQRACKYHLLFKDLSRHTPVIDCPSSHMEIEKTISKLLNISTNVNTATNNPKVRMAVEKTRTLQTRLVFPDQVGEDWRRRNRWLGHLQLCGVLHVCWQTKEAMVEGQYMAALLYREWLCLATAEGPEQRYSVQVCIALSNLKLEEVDNNRGIQCHSARHSWKIVFISGNQLYELMLTACSPKEELEWRSWLSQSLSASPSDDQEPAEMEGYTAHSMNIKTLGTVYRKSGTRSGNVSIHRATTIGPKPPLCQVILKNTSGGAKKQVTPPPSPSPAPIGRSQTIPSPTARVAVIAPPRAERARLEALLADLWSRDVLPFPGLLTPRSRSEQLVRASASSVMRKLSSVSITSSFRRSSSLASLRAADKSGAGEERGVAPSSSFFSSPGPAGYESVLPQRVPPEGGFLTRTPPPVRPPRSPLLPPSKSPGSCASLGNLPQSASLSRLRSVAAGDERPPAAVSPQDIRVADGNGYGHGGLSSGFVDGPQAPGRDREDLRRTAVPEEGTGSEPATKRSLSEIGGLLWWRKKGQRRGEERRR